MTSIERKAELLEAARSACCGDRALNYGAPEDNLQRIAELWNAYLAIKGERTIKPVDVGSPEYLIEGGTSCAQAWPPAGSREMATAQRTTLTVY